MQNIMGVPAQCQDYRLAIHYSWMVERIAHFRILQNLLVAAGHVFMGHHVINGSFKLINSTADNSQSRVFLKFLKLQFTAVGQRHIVRIHPGNQFVPALGQTAIQGIPQSPIDFQTDDPEYILMSIIHFLNYQIQFLCQGTIAH